MALYKSASFTFTFYHNVSILDSDAAKDDCLLSIVVA